MSKIIKELKVVIPEKRNSCLDGINIFPNSKDESFRKKTNLNTPQSSGYTPSLTEPHKPTPENL